MVYASVVKINPDNDEQLPNHPGLPFPLKPMSGDINLDRDYSIREAAAGFSIIKTVKFTNVIQAYDKIDKLLKSKNSNKIGVIIHDCHISISEAVDLLTLNENKTIQKVAIRNPFKGDNPPKRRRVAQSKGMYGVQVTPALKSQLYAILGEHNADTKLIGCFSLKDEQQQRLYEWEDKTFPKTVTTMDSEQAIKLLKNVLNYSKLPWIKVNLLASGKSCSFSLKLKKGGKSLSPESKDKDDSNNDTGWGRGKPDLYDALDKEIKNGNFVSIDNMEFNFAMNWGLNPYVIIHEISHYVQFCMPTRYMINQGELPLSFNSYQELFAGHGAIFTGVFAKLLITFMHIDEDDLYRSLKKSNLSFIRIDDLSPCGVDTAIKSFIENKQ